MCIKATGGVGGAMPEALATPLAAACEAEGATELLAVLRERGIIPEATGGAAAGAEAKVGESDTAEAKVAADGLPNVEAEDEGVVFRRLSIPVMCVPSDVARSLLELLDVPGAEQPAALHRERMTRQLQARGYARELATRAVDKAWSSPAKRTHGVPPRGVPGQRFAPHFTVTPMPKFSTALAWLEDNAEWLEQQDALLAELEHDMLDEELEAATGKASAASAGGGGRAASPTRAGRQRRRTRSSVSHDGEGGDAAEYDLDTAGMSPKEEEEVIALFVKQHGREPKMKPHTTAAVATAFARIAGDSEWPLALRWETMSGAAVPDVTRFDVMAAAATTSRQAASLVCAGAVLRSLVTQSTGALLSSVVSTLRDLTVQYARRAVVGAVCFWPATEKPVTELTTPQTFRTILRIGLTLTPYAAAATLDDDGHVAVTDFPGQVSQIVEAEVGSAGNSDRSYVVTAMVQDVKDAAEQQAAAVSKHALRRVVKPSRVVTPLKGFGVGTSSMGPTLVHVGGAKSLRVDMRPSVNLRRRTDGQNNQLPNNCALRFYGDEDRTQVLGQVQNVASATTDFTVQGDSVYYDVVDSRTGRVARGVMRQRLGQSSYEVHVFATAGTALNDADAVAPSMPTALAMVDLLLHTEALSAYASHPRGVPSAARFVPPLLEGLLSALPFVADSDLARQCCRVMARLFRRWGATVPDNRAGGIGAELGAATADADATRARKYIARAIPMLQRAHSWLRTCSMARWGRTSLPPHIQSLMELLLAATKAASRLNLRAFAAGDAGSDASSSKQEEEAATDYTDSDMVYLQGREGPRVCSLLNISASVVNANMTAEAQMYVPVAVAVCANAMAA